jgi:hypothetical protein
MQDNSGGCPDVSRPDDRKEVRMRKRIKSGQTVVVTRVLASAAGLTALAAVLAAPLKW